MGITRQILLHPTNRTLLFSGDKTRLRLIRRLALELEKDSKLVVLLSCGDSLLPPSGQLVVGAAGEILADQIQRAFVKDKLVYTASALSGNHAKGFSLSEVHELVQLLPETCFLIDAGEKATSNSMAKTFDQHCLCLDAEQLNSTAAKEKMLKQTTSLSRETANKTLLFVDAIRTLDRENRFLSLSREWLAGGVEHVVLADLSRDFLRIVEHA